jgi:hypothetical protein
MIRLTKFQPGHVRSYAVCCDSKGRSGYWSCENLGPESCGRDSAGESAKAAGWIVARGKWYCPDCQRDGFVPALPRQMAGISG